VGYGDGGEEGGETEGRGGGGEDLESVRRTRAYTSALDGRCGFRRAPSARRAAALAHRRGSFAAGRDSLGAVPFG
jgi:hypothetical protein